MTLYLDARTNCSDLMVDFIEVQLSNGEVVSLNWDQSGIDRDDAGFSARYKGVYLGEEHANGRLNNLREMKIQMVQVYTELGIPVTFQIDEMLLWMQKKSCGSNHLLMKNWRWSDGSKITKPKVCKDRLQDAIRSLGTMMGLNNAFTKFLELTATALGAVLDPVNAKERNQQYEDAQKGLKPDEISEFARMTALLWLSVLEYKEEPEDILGDIYHSLRLNNEWNGQFFTPDHIARLMAKLSNPVSESGSDEGYVTINEPTCGSGTMVIACIWEMKREALIIETNPSLWRRTLISAVCGWHISS